VQSHDDGFSTFDDRAAASDIQATTGDRQLEARDERVVHHHMIRDRQEIASGLACGPALASGLHRL
jgi:hypothetical protein